MVRYVNPPNHHPTRITKTDTEFANRLDLILKIKNQNPVKIRDIQKINKEKNSLIFIMVLPMEVKKNIQFMYQNNSVKKNISIYY